MQRSGPSDWHVCCQKHKSYNIIQKKTVTDRIIEIMQQKSSPNLGITRGQSLTLSVTITANSLWVQTQEIQWYFWKNTLF